ncbi:MAG TPA: carboxypeptidase regulatory-like domain-containing protein [Candidatus Acidoferrum sp.]|nr:carboxypeptidase regulatory-like domain-containing protein [Candidatus Acidoferrum sp.]
MWPARMLAFAVVCVLFAGFASSRAAESAGCTGLVVDENGVPLPAAQISLTNATGQMIRAETDGAGRFIMKKLAAGDYKVEVRKEGFFVLAGRTVTLRAGSNELTFTLNHAEEVHTQVQVTAPANQIDPQDTVQRSTLTNRAIRDIPVANSHVLNESLVALPEIVQDHLSNIHVAGARSGETQYLLDGFEIGDPANNQLTSRFNIDATRAAEVQTGRFGSEYAHSGASVLSLETPDGDDKWRFGTTNPAPGVNIQQGVHLGNWYPRFTFSGPIVRGHFWFSDALSLQHTFGVVEGLPRGVNTAEQWAGDELLRLQYNATPKHVVHGTFLYNRLYAGNLGLDALDPISTTVTGEQGRSFFALKDQVWLHDTLIDLGVAADTAALDYTPQGSAPLVLLVNGSSGNFFDRSHQRAQRLQAMGSVTAASRRWHGVHTLAVGANVSGLSYSLTSFRGTIQALRAFQANGTTPCTSATPDCLARQSTFGGPAEVDLSNTQAGAYAQDTWALSKFVIVQSGVRMDWDRFTQSAMAEPRFSGNLLPFGDDRSKISLGWGIYNAPLNLTVIGQTLDQRQLDRFFDTSGNILPPGAITSQFALPAGGLRQPRFTIGSVGWQQKFAHGTLFGLELLARNGYHGFAFVDQQPSQPGGIFLLQDHRKDRYRAATVSLRHVFSEDLEFYGAYTRSVAHSNEVFNPTLGSIFYTAQLPGPVAWDAPNRVITWGWAPTHIWKILLTYFLEYRTGYPYSAFNSQQQIVGAANSLRFPDYASLNVGIEKKFGFRGYLWGVRVESINILGRKNPDTVVSNVDAPNFGAFAGGQGRALTLRVRFIGRR